MGELRTLQQREREAAQAAAIARRRSLARRVGAPLVWKYLQVVPSLFELAGDFSAFDLLVPESEALLRLSQSAILTLDSASEKLGRFRFGSGRHIFAWFESDRDVESISDHGIGRPVHGTMMPLLLAAQGQPMLFAVVGKKLPPHVWHSGFRAVTRQHLIREFLGFYGLRLDLLVQIENKLLAAGE